MILFRLAKKFFSLLTSALGVLIISGFLSLQPVAEGPAKAHHLDTPPCKDVTMTSGKVLTEAVKVSNVANSGQMNFSDTNLAHDYEACADLENLSLKGWVWNTNLGWTSFFCDAGKNLGIDCGTQNYAATINKTTGDFAGFAWGDNIGWISLSGVTYNVKAAITDNTNGGSCGANLNKGDLYGYAWTDSVGWINFCGAHVDLAPSLTINTEFTTTNEGGGDDGGGGGNGGGGGGGGSSETGALTEFPEGKVYANGDDAHIIVVKILENGSPLTDLGAHTAKVTGLTWENNLRTDQVTHCTPDDALSNTIISCIHDGAITPSALDFTWDSALSGLKGSLKAIAPTNPPDTIKLTAIDVEVDGTTYHLEKTVSFEFLPAVSVSQITPDPVSTVLNSSEPVYVTTEKHEGSAVPNDNQIKLYAQLHDCDSDTYDFIFDENEPGSVFNPDTGELTEQPSTGQTGNLANVDRPNAVCSATSGDTLTDMLENTFKTGVSTYLIYTYLQSGASDPGAATLNNAVGLRTRVEYKTPGGKDIRYFSAAVKDGSVLNQAANVYGNVKIDVQKSFAQNVIEQSVGKNAKLRREKIYKAIRRLVTAVQKTNPVSAPNFISPENIANFTSASNKIAYFSRKNLGTTGDKPCKIIIGDKNAADDSDLNFTNTTTIVAEGCDVFIDQNIISKNAAATEFKELGIVALEDLTLDSDRRGGNIYICNRVTDLKIVNFVADGSLFPYGESETVCGDKDDDALIDQTTGMPKYKISPYVAGRRQLTVTGSLISNNTYGGAFLSPPILGDGTPVADAADVSKARLYDLNFLRYAQTEYNENYSSKYCWHPDTKLSKTLGDNCINNNPKSRGIVNIIYRAASGPVLKEAK